MTSVPYFNRYCILEVYNEQAGKAIVYRGNASEKSADNGFVNTRIDFLVQKTKEKNNLPSAEIKIYNVSNYSNEDSAKNQVLQENAFVRLFVGYSYDFENNTEMQPVFEGEILTIQDASSPPDTYKILRCYGGLQLRAKRLPSISLKGQVSVANILSTINGRLQDIGFQIDIDSLKKVYPNSNNIISNRGYMTNGTSNISNFLDQLTSSISSFDTKITWVADDLTKKVYFYNLILYKEQNNQNAVVELIRGVNAKLVDNSSVERNNRELYYQKVANAGKKLSALQKKQARIGRSTTGYKNSVIITSPIFQGITLNTNFKLTGFGELPKNLSLSTLRWIGDTHDTGGKWGIEYVFTYERRSK